MFLWIDLETTGLDPVQDIPLEVGLILTDNKLNCVDAFSRVLPVKNWDTTPTSEFVEQMHTKNNLLADIETMRRNGVEYESYHEVDFMLYDWLYNHHLHLDGLDHMFPSGSSVHFDIDFCKKYFPEFSTLLYHRHLDVSSIKLGQMIRMGEYDPGPEDSHRAIDDLLNDISWLRKSLLLPPGDYPTREEAEALYTRPAD